MPAFLPLVVDCWMDRARIIIGHSNVADDADLHHLNITINVFFIPQFFALKVEVLLAMKISQSNVSYMTGWLRCGENASKDTKAASKTQCAKVSGAVMKIGVFVLLLSGIHLPLLPLFPTKMHPLQVLTAEVPWSLSTSAQC